MTLTYREEDLPNPPTVRVDHFQKFIKKLRKAVEPKVIRYFHCGEYGDEKMRPHYHAIIFNHDFEDKKLWKLSNGLPLYISEQLSSIWGYGFCSVGAVTFESSAYVARYIMKKITGEPAEDHYTYVDPLTGEISQLAPEYVTMSRRPGIGKVWLEMYRDDVWPGDFVVVDTKKLRPPRFYDKVLEEESFRMFRKVKGERERNAEKHADNNTPDRLKVRRKVQEAKLKQLPRKDL